MAKVPIFIIGFGGNAVEAIDAVEHTYEIIGFIDDNPERQKLTYCLRPVYPRQILDKYKEAKVITLIGSEITHRYREQTINSFKLDYSRFATVVDPCARVSPRAKIGRDVIVFAGTIITANAVIGDHVFILPNTVIHHDVGIGDYTIIGSSVTVAGHVKVGKSCYIGSASSLKNNIEIGDGSMIGMAANVLSSVRPGSTMIGNPARKI